MRKDPDHDMTTPSKIHRQDPEKPSGTAVCGRDAPPDRITTDPTTVTCGVCRTFQPEARPGDLPSRPAGPTVIDRLVAASAGDLARLDEDATARVRSRAKTRALFRVAARRPDEFRDAYREELAAAMLAEEVGDDDQDLDTLLGA